MSFKGKIFDEPLLEFGDQFSHPDPRLGLAQAGPLQTPLGDTIRLAVVGSAETIEHTQEFISAASEGFESDAEKHLSVFKRLRHSDAFGSGEIGSSGLV